MRRLSFLLLLFSTVLINADPIYLIKDKNLKKCIEDELKVEDVSYDKIKFLDCSSREIYQLEGIEALKSMKSIDLGNNNIIDFSPLQELKILEYLDASMNYRVKNKSRICDKGNKQCEKWNDENTRTLIDLQSIFKLKNLKGLALCGTFLRDISGIESLLNLENLFLHSLEIKDFSVLEKLRNLKVLSISEDSVVPKSLNNKNINVWHIKNKSSNNDLNISKYLMKRSFNSPFFPKYVAIDTGNALLISRYEVLLKEMALSPLSKENTIRFLVVDEPKITSTHSPTINKEKPFEKFRGFELQKTKNKFVLKCFGDNEKTINIEKLNYSEITSDLIKLKEQLVKNKGAHFLSDDRVIFIEEIDNKYIGQSFACTDDIKLCYEEANAFVKNVCQSSNQE